MKKKIQILYVSLVMLLLLGAAVFTAFGPRDEKSVFENRKLEPMPGFTIESAADGSLFSKIERYLADRMAGRSVLQRASVRLDMLINRPVINGIVKTEEALLPFFDYDDFSEKELEEKARLAAENVSEIEARVAEYGGKYLYVAVPAQYTIFKDSYPAYMDSHYERLDIAKNAFLANVSELTHHRALLLDMGNLLSADEYSAVDHHFTIEGAKKTFEAICFLSSGEYCRSTPRMPYEPILPSLLDAEIPFETITLSNTTLGSRGKQLFGMGGFVEHFSYMVPKEEIPYTRTDYNEPSGVPIIVLPEDENAWVEYTAFMGGDYGKTCIDTNRPNLPTVLIYGDSFTNAIESLLYTRCDKMYSVDMRHCIESLGSIIDEVQPDYVICVRDYSGLIDTTGNGRGLE